MTQTSETMKWNPTADREARRARAKAIPADVKRAAYEAAQEERRARIAAEYIHDLNVAPVLRKFGCDLTDAWDYQVNVTFTTGTRYTVQIVARDYDGETRRFQVKFGPRGGRSLHPITD